MDEVKATPVEDNRPIIKFVHYQTKEVREVREPDKIQQMSRDFITAFMTSEEHYEDLPWYREMRDEALTTTKAEYEAKNNPLGEADLQMRAFPKVRVAFAKKYYPELAPKEKEPKAAKPSKLSLWDI